MLLALFFTFVLVFAICYLFLHGAKFMTRSPLGGLIIALSVIGAFILIVATNDAHADQAVAAMDSGRYLYVLSDAKCKLPNGDASTKIYLMNLEGTNVIMRGCVQLNNSQFIMAHWENGTMQPLPIIGFQKIQ